MEGIGVTLATMVPFLLISLLGRQVELLLAVSVIQSLGSGVQSPAVNAIFPIWCPRNTLPGFRASSGRPLHANPCNSRDCPDSRDSGAEQDGKGRREFEFYCLHKRLTSQKVSKTYTDQRLFVIKQSSL